MQYRRTGALTAAALLTLAACGPGSDDATSTPAEQPTTTEAPAGDDFTDGDSTQDEPADVAAVGEPEAAEPTEAPVDEQVDEANEVESDAPVEQADPIEEEAPPEPVATEAPEPEPPAQPVLGGRLFAADVQPAAQFDGNPFPDLIVEDVGKDAQVNIKNILPSDRPILLWAWAPH